MGCLLICGFPVSGQSLHEFGEKIRSVASRTVVIDITGWARETLQETRDQVNRLREPEFHDELIKKLFEAKKRFQDESGKDSDFETARTRQWLEEQFERWRGPGGKSVPEFARETVSKYLPALQGTDYAQDPIKTLTYLLILDGKGFIRDIKCVRGPLGQPMTLLEAYETYSRTDPKKAEDVLEIMDNIRKLSDPGCEKERVPILLDAIARTLRVFLQ